MNTLCTFAPIYWISKILPHLSINSGLGPELIYERVNFRVIYVFVAVCFAVLYLKIMINAATHPCLIQKLNINSHKNKHRFL